ncbi:MAG: restriction endonuclease subunit S, partial [Prevotella salivae]|nr:restriction endonuclease subunit S [Segatella salivae]
YYEKFADGKVVCIDDEIPFEIPESWTWGRLSNMVLINPKNYIDDNKEAAFIPMEKIEATYLSSYTYTVRKWREIKSGYTHFADGDVAFAKITPCFQNRKSMILNNLPNGIGAGTTELKVLRPYRNTLSVEYLLFFLESPYFVEEAVFKGTANQQRIISGYLENKLFPLPPLNEQRSIAEKIKKSIVAVEQYGKVQDKLEDLNNNLNTLLKKSVLQEAIQGKLVPQDPNDEPTSVLLQHIKEEKQRLVKEGKLKKKDVVDSVIYKGDDNKYYEQIGRDTIEISNEILFDLPCSWQWVRFGQIVRMSIGKTPARGEVSYWSKATIPWVSISDMTNSEHINKTKEKISVAASSVMGEISPVGSLLMSFKLTVGRTSILNIDAYHNEAIISIYPFIDDKYALRDYLFYTLPFLSNMGDSKDAIKGKTLNSKSLKSLLIPLPPLREQRCIINRLEELYAHL